MAAPIANLSAVVTGAVHAAMGFATEMLPTGVTSEAARASVAWFLRHLWAWLVAARAGAVESLPVAAEAARRAAGSAAEASEPWLKMVAALLHGLYGWLAAVSAMANDKLPEAAATTASVAKIAAGTTFEAMRPWLEMAWKLSHDLYGRLTAAAAEKLADAAAMSNGEGAESTASPNSHYVAAQVLVVLALLGVVFLCGAVWALTCRTMKAPGLGGARIPRAMFKANPRRYYAAVRTARKARRGASGPGWKLLVAAPIVAYAAYLVAKTLY